MKRTITVVGFAAIVAVMLLTKVGVQGQPGAGSGSLAGGYYCYPICESYTPVVLSENANWHWGGFSGGTFKVTNGTIVFDGFMGPATWGPAVLGPGSLTFTSEGPSARQIVWRKPGPIPPELPGDYYEGRATLQLRADASWTSQLPRAGGRYIVWDGKDVRFLGIRGPAEWGVAQIGNGTLTFHLSGYNTVGIPIKAHTAVYQKR
jgi:hypothetical protein